MTHAQLRAVVRLWLFVATAMAAAWLIANAVRAQDSSGLGNGAEARPVSVRSPGNSLEPDNWAPLMLARVCEYEADKREADCVAMWWVAVKRAAVSGDSPLAMLLRYSTLLRSRTERGKRIREGTPPASLLELAAELLRGEHDDPCRSATHWGGRGDAARGRMVPARCSAKTANVFYRLERSR